MNEFTNKNQIANDFRRLAVALIDLDKKTRNYGTDVPIFCSEIHVIKAIAEHPGINVGGLADILGITKGATSEILKKLERKALVKKEIDDLNLSRYLLSLTEKGKIAHSDHMRYHSLLNSMIEEKLQNASEHEMEFLSSFLSDGINIVKYFEKNS